MRGIKQSKRCVLVYAAGTPAGGECLALGTRHQAPGVGVAVQWKPPCSPDKIEQACGRSTVRGIRQTIRCVLVYIAGTPAGGECLPHGTRDQAPCRWCGFATEAAMQLRLIEKACGYSTVRCGGNPHTSRMFITACKAVNYRVVLTQLATS